MATVCKFLVMLMLLLSVTARPSDHESGADRPDDAALANLETAESNPQLYLIVAEAVGGEEEEEIVMKKRSAEELDDLETAAGTNVLRPLFVYRQQLAYRERVKKGAAARRAGIRPRF